jgi:hypothetical protein
MKKQSEAERELVAWWRQSFPELWGHQIQWLLNWRERHSQRPKVSKVDIVGCLITGGHSSVASTTQCFEIADRIMALIEGKQEKPEPTWCSHWKFDNLFPHQPWVRADIGNKTERVRVEAMFCYLCGSKRPAE